MKIEEIIALTDADIVKRIQEERDAFSGLEFQKSTGQVLNNSQFGKIKRTIAKMKTILRQRELATKNAK